MGLLMPLSVADSKPLLVASVEVGVAISKNGARMSRKPAKERVREGAEEVLRQYFRILVGQRKHEEIARILGKSRQAVEAIDNGQNKVMADHLVSFGREWSISPRRMFGDLAVVAMNLELGRNPAEGVGGEVVSAPLTKARPEERSSRPARAAEPSSPR